MKGYKCNKTVLAVLVLSFGLFNSASLQANPLVGGKESLATWEPILNEYVDYKDPIVVGMPSPGGRTYCKVKKLLNENVKNGDGRLWQQLSKVGKYVFFEYCPEDERLAFLLSLNELEQAIVLRNFGSSLSHCEKLAEYWNFVSDNVRGVVFPLVNGKSSFKLKLFKTLSPEEKERTFKYFVYSKINTYNCDIVSAYELLTRDAQVKNFCHFMDQIFGKNIDNSVFSEESVAARRSAVVWKIWNTFNLDEKINNFEYLCYLGGCESESENANVGTWRLDVNLILQSFREIVAKKYNELGDNEEFHKIQVSLFNSLPDVSKDSLFLEFAKQYEGSGPREAVRAFVKQYEPEIEEWEYPEEFYYEGIEDEGYVDNSK